MTTEPEGAGAEELAIADTPAPDATPKEEPKTEEKAEAKTYTEEDVKKYQRDLDRERRRIGKITAQKYDFKAKYEQLNQKYAELEKKIPQTSEPDIRQYSDYNKYQKDLIDHQIKQNAPKETTQQAPQEDIQKQIWRAQRQPAVLQSVEQAKQTFPDIQQKLQANAQLLDTLPMHVADAILELDSPALAIAQLIEDGMIPHLAGMTPETASAFIERAEDKALSRQKPPPVTKAPPPMSSARGTASGSKSLDQMSGDELLKWVNAK